jgi:hypothetical protein
MTLQASGAISLAQVNQELGRSSGAQISLNVYSASGTAVVQIGGGTVNINQCSPARPNTSAPTSMDEWYSYNHNASCGGDTYPCTIDSSISTTGSGYNTLVYDNYGYLWASEAAARAALSAGNYLFNLYGGFSSTGSTLSNVGVSVGNILKNMSVSDGRNRCGYLLWADNSAFWVLALDKSGQIIEKLST